MKITVVGTGMVGSSFAYRLLVSGIATEIVLIDANHERALGEASDMSHAVAVENSTRVYAGTYEDSKESDIIVIAAGLNDLTNGTRLDLCIKNAEIFKQIVPPLAAASPKGFFLVASNPMDVMTAATLKYSGLPESQVLGSGTVLDSARLRFELSHKLKVSPTEIAAYILGEHGDSQVAVFSHVSARGIPMEVLLKQLGATFPKDEQETMAKRVCGAAYEIVSRKKATYYGIASALLRIVKAIRYDERVILPVSCMPHGEYGLEGMYLALPAIIGKHGVERILELELNDNEHTRLVASATQLKEYVDKLP